MLKVVYTCVLYKAPLCSTHRYLGHSRPVLRGFKGFSTPAPIGGFVEGEKTRVRPLLRPWYPPTTLEKSQNPESEKKFPISTTSTPTKMRCQMI